MKNAISNVHREFDCNSQPARTVGCKHMIVEQASEVSQMSSLLINDTSDWLPRYDERYVW
jgi:hypothetical protein